MNKKDLARTDCGAYYLIGAGKRAHKIFKISYQMIKENIMGKSTVIEIVVNSPVDNDIVLVYSFDANTLKKDEFLRALLFGRDTTNYQFTATNAIIANLYADYVGNVTDIKNINDFNFAENCGTQGEKIRISDGGKSWGYKMDKIHKVDYSINKHYTQCKVSLKHHGTAEHDSKSYSYSKTNKSAF